MPEAVSGYPRWRGELSRAPSAMTIARQEFMRGYRDRWVGYAFAGFLVLAALRKATQLASRAGEVNDFQQTLTILDWGALAMVAIMAGPAFLDDVRLGALELYLSRGATRVQYIVGKSLAVFAMAFAGVAGAAMIYYLSSLLTQTTHPEGWAWVWAGILGHSAIWAFVVTGLGLGLSCVLRSSRVATLILLGGVLMLDIIFSNILTGIANNDVFQLMSPVANLKQVGTWLFPGATAAYDFPVWWSALVLGGLAVLGWALVYLRAPRAKGVE